MSDITSLKAIEAAKLGQAPATAGAGATTTAAANRAAGGELDAGKSTVKGSVDYFNGKSVITDADTVIDIAKIMDESKASNMSPEKMAAKLKEKGYDVQVVKIGNRRRCSSRTATSSWTRTGTATWGPRTRTSRKPWEWSSRSSG